jgi:hypothetical protein
MNIRIVISISMKVVIDVLIVIALNLYMKFHPTLIKMAITQRTKNQQWLVCIWRKKNAYTLLVGISVSTAM